MTPDAEFAFAPDAPADGEDQAPVLQSVVIERREPSMWRKPRTGTTIAMRDPRFVIDPDTGNS